ncbi:uncharacterized protein [Nicotiana tomentosiformis]|uniref:Uncharacterized protein n=1 Tax=Nicotiana tabacum TaxID=4097 RepID=A0A1S3XJM6_TOBAC|nr:uncharacterized protein LOC104102890 [Nicotiana tomentosiformis]XP_016440126.1 PREDICTED: uncharacterized protein LOC107765945 [Nicotiana tabacum]
MQLVVSFYSTIVFQKQKLQRNRESKISRKMNQNMSAFLIGMVGAAFTLGAYSQPWMTPTQSITTGLLTLMFGLLVREGFISL